MLIGECGIDWDTLISVNIGQKSIEEVVVLLVQLLELLDAGREVHVLLALVLLECRLRLVDLRREAVVGDEDQRLDALVVTVEEVLHGFRRTGVEGAQRVVETQLLLENPGQPALPHEDAGGELAEQGGIELVELLLHLEVLRKEPVPLPEPLRKQKLGVDVGALSGCRDTQRALRVATRTLITCGSQVLGAVLQTWYQSGYSPYSQRSRQTLCGLWFMVVCLRGSSGAQLQQNLKATAWLSRRDAMREVLTVVLIILSKQYLNNKQINLNSLPLHPLPQLQGYSDAKAKPYVQQARNISALILRSV